MRKTVSLLLLLAATSVFAGNSEKLEWNYDKSSDTYYIVGIVYCDNPADESYEQMGIYVPGAYMNANSNGDGTYTCTINNSGQLNGFTASTAPIVIPVNTAGYKAMSPPSGFSNKVTNYTEKGFVYLFAGCRGKDASAPSAITDLKSAVKYFRYLSAEGCVPGNTDRIFSFGHSGGGAQSAILGASGNSSLYNEYLEELGAKTDYRDDIAGSMCWCPITNLDLGSEGYEWNMGLSRSGLSDTEQNISKALAEEFAKFINTIGLKNPTTGETLTLSATSDGYYQSGTYYEYMMEVINDAVNRYNKYNNASVSTYTTTDASALSSFAKSYKSATKGLGAFDNYTKSRTSAGNQLFDPEGEWAHFDKYLAEIVATYDPAYYSDFETDLAKVDRFGNDRDTRVAMYTPLYYLINEDTYYAGGGEGSSDVASYWRIRTGIKQGDTSLCTEVNLALALLGSGIEDVDFETIWGQGHTQAEDTGDGTDNFIEWVENCCKKEEQKATGIERIPTEQEEQTVVWYTLSGQRISEKPQRGIYIENGVKKIAK